MSFSINQIFTATYPPEAAQWCNENKAYIEATGDGRYIIKAIPAPSKTELATARIAELQAYLSSTDWYAVRYAETGVGVPEDVKAKRQAARVEIDELREVINELV